MPTERNLLIEAGAGTGKTTRLVKAILEALFGRQIALESIVALTFTNKAAAELKERVGIALDDVLNASSLDDLRRKPWWSANSPSLPLTEFKSHAAAAMDVIDRANISTIHSFAFSLLKRFPLAAGIDPGAAIDNKKLRFDELFREEWPLWLSTELGENPPRKAAWLELLSKVPLSKIEEAARALADFDVPLSHLRLSDADLPVRLKPLHEEARALCASRGTKLNAGEVAEACEEILGIATSGQWQKLDELTAEVRESLAKKPGQPKAWPAEDIQRLKYLQSAAENVVARGDHVLALLTEILEPFIRLFRERLLSEGCLTHSALLYLSREIVKNNPSIRETLKKDIGFILIDEFQDTDPLQAELLLFLAEAPGKNAVAWDKVHLAPGKLFIVGDPKQSIYRFRGADIAAYEEIGKLVVDQAGARETLKINYRSQEQVIHIVNQSFQKIIAPIPLISPPYVAVTPHHMKDPAHDVQDVALWLAESETEQSVEDAQETEAEHVARWIKENVGHMTVHDAREGRRRPLLYLDIALIFRTYSPMDRFVEALKRHGIPFAVESERYFFSTPEVTDFINLLRAADDPSDTLSLVGFLRGPLGGLTDEEILKRRQAGTLEDSQPAQWLRRITERLKRETLADVLQTIFEETWLLEQAARSYHGDQTVANLMKLRRLLEELAAEGLTTMDLLLRKLREFFADDTIEGESPLADEKYNAVRLLTVHKAKGLEFPVVFLPSLHSGLRDHGAADCLFDWRTQKLGLKVAGFCNLDKLELDRQARERDAAEQNRILYVAMTRARECLILSGGLNLKAASSNTYLQKLVSSLGQSLDHLQEGRLSLGETTLTVRRLQRSMRAAGADKSEQENPQSWVEAKEFAAVWRKRQNNYAEALKTPLIMTPSGAKQETGDTPAVFTPRSSSTKGSDPLLLGTLLHFFLKKWDFSAEKCTMPAALRAHAGALFASGSVSVDRADTAVLIDEAQRVLAQFIGSEAWQEIKNAEIVGREIPFFYRREDLGGRLVRGQMDILYRTPDGEFILGDYKTDRITTDALETQSARYTAQTTAYKIAVVRALNEAPRVKLIYLRLGKAVELRTEGAAHVQ